MYIGQSMKRDEDDRFTTGRGQFVDDMVLPNTAFLAVLRSPHAHAKIKRLSTSAATAAPGALRVLTIDDWQRDRLGTLPCFHAVPFDDGRPMHEVTRPVFADGTVRFVGDCVAAVVAETRQQALDALELIEVDYEILPAVVAVVAALRASAPLLHPQFGTNLVQFIERGDKAKAAQVFQAAHHTTELRLRNTRITGNPIEPRSYLGHYDGARGRYTLWGTLQAPHYVRNWIAKHTLFVPEHKVRIVAPDVGGGFGPKIFYYGEMPIVLWASKLVGRPVRWTATRSESLMTDSHARDHDTTARMAFDHEGRVLGMEVETYAGYGAYQSTFASGIPMRFYPPTLTGVYRTPVIYVKVIGAYTNTGLIDAYRGSGQATVSVTERLFENGARELGIDPMLMRERNYIAKESYPYTNPLGRVYESGDPVGVQHKLRALACYDDLRREQKEAKARGIRIGIGMAAFVESAGSGPSRMARKTGSRHSSAEVATVRVHPDGKVTVLAGTHSHGQSHDITFRQIAADKLGLDILDIGLIEGDTDAVPTGSGTWAARSLLTAGSAIVEGSKRIISKMTKLAAHMLECAAEDIDYRNAVFTVAGTDRRATFADVAEMAFNGFQYPDGDFELGLDATVYYDPISVSSPTAMHLAVVVVDDESGHVTLRNFFSVDDSGRVINPMVVHGQVHGGLGQGIGQALMERVVYDEKSGQLLTGSFMDYAMPRASDLPNFIAEFHETLNPNTVLGAKGCSESGSLGPPAAIGNAIVDALWDLGVRHVELPFTPERVWQAIKTAAPAGW